MERKNKNIGLIGTITFHVTVLLLVIFFGFVTPFPLPEEEGVLINFGTDATGSGQVETQFSQVIPKPQPEPQPVQKSEPVSESSPEDKKEVLTQDYEQTAMIEEQKRKEKERTVEEEKKEKQRREEEVERKRLEEIEKQKREEQERIAEQQRKIAESTKQAFGQADTKSQSDGTGNAFGNQGDPKGSPDSKSYTGNDGPGKDGIGYSLAGRTPQGGQLPLPNYPSKEDGTVIIKVKVDQNGNVTDAEWEPRGSTTTNKQLINAAVEAAKKAKFNRDAKADLIQVGTITYRFNIR
jgi:TonB family protein